MVVARYCTAAVTYLRSVRIDVRWIGLAVEGLEGDSTRMRNLPPLKRNLNSMGASAATLLLSRPAPDGPMYIQAPNGRIKFGRGTASRPNLSSYRSWRRPTRVDLSRCAPALVGSFEMVVRGTAARAALNSRQWCVDRGKWSLGSWSVERGQLAAHESRGIRAFVMGSDASPCQRRLQGGRRV